jgi:hypothetical protein
MNRKFLMLALVVILSFFCFGFEGTLLKDYQTKNQNGKDILATLISFEEAYNNHDIEKVLSYLSNEGQFIVYALYEGGRQTGVHKKVSKKDYQDALPSFLEFDSKTHYNPKITISGDKGFVVLGIVSGMKTTDPASYTMKKEKDKWLILDMDD